MGVGIEGAEDNFFYKEYELTVLVSLNQYGFPIYEASQKTSPLAVDFDNDGEDEIIFGDYHGIVHIINNDGSELFTTVFPFDTGAPIWSSPAAADLDGNGLIEVVITSKSKHLYIFENGELKVNFNTELYDVDSSGVYLIGTPAIGNLDDDAELEVVFSGYSNNNKLFVINHDGSLVDGFPIPLYEKVKRGVALADFNNNDKDDIVLGTDGGQLYLILDDGTTASVPKTISSLSLLLKSANATPLLTFSYKGIGNPSTKDPS
jgi:hypothetical protein